MFGPKDRFCLFDDASRRWNAAPEMELAISTIEEAVRAGTVYHPFTTWARKDEAVRASKEADARIRVFNIIPFAFNVVLKKYLGPVALFMQAHRDFFETAVGLDMASKEAATLIRRLLARSGERDLTSASGGRCIDGDFSKYDKRQATILLYGVVAAIVRVAEHLPYERDDLVALRCLLLGCVHYVVVATSSVVLVSSANPSGGVGTVTINCVMLSIIFRIAFLVLSGGKPPGPFRQFVTLIGLGDDSLQAVSPKIPWYNFTSLCAFFPNLGHVLKPGDKGDGMYLYKPIGAVSFLKRRFRFDPHLKRWCAALDFVSLARQSQWKVRTDELDEDEHEAVILSNMAREFFLHGREVFEAKRVMLLDAADRAGVAGHPRLKIDTWQSVRDSFLDGSFSVWAAS
jgi:hypothetical protein